MSGTMSEYAQEHVVHICCTLWKDFPVWGFGSPGEIAHIHFHTVDTHGGLKLILVTTAFFLCLSGPVLNLVVDVYFEF